MGHLQDLREMRTIDIDEFIDKYITGRSESMFAPDRRAHAAQLHTAIQGRSALVIGGAGSIGSAFIKVLIAYNPARLLVVDTSENGLTELTRDLRSSRQMCVPADYRTYPIDFGDALFARLVQREGRFDIVANFAAHKHVRSERDQYSVAAMLQNNVLRNAALLELLADAPPKHFFCVSTDKAANPVNIMGASKKLMEEVLLAYADVLPVVTARFANVAFSQGSLLDGFLYRLRKRQPLSAPRDVRRYFVSPRESGELCLLACLLGKPGEIFFPKLEAAQMKTFAGIADDLLHALGLVPDYCHTEDDARRKASQLNADSAAWPVWYFDSDTTGEKQCEEFYTEREEPDFARFESVGVVRSVPRLLGHDIPRVVTRLRGLMADARTGKRDIVAFLEEVVPEFHHYETGKSLDDRM